MSKYKINYVLEGQGKDGIIVYSYNNLRIIGKHENYVFEKFYVESYQVIDETNKEQFSFWKGALGAALLGSLGAVAGIKGRQRKEYLIAINWKNGEKSLILIDDEYYKVLVKCLF